MSSKFKVALASLFVFLLSTPHAFANLEGRWIQHPAAALRSAVKQSQVDRIIDGNRYVYFSVRGSAFNRNQKHYYTSAIGIDKDFLQLFRYDKTTPWEEQCIRPISEEFELSGANHELVNYSPEHHLLAVIYENRAMDFIYDDGSLIKSAALKNASSPTRTFQPYSITFDAEKPLAYIAGSFGIATVNMKNGELEEIADFGVPVSWASRIGENMVVFAGSVSVSNYSTNTYIYVVGATPQKLSLPIAGGENLQVLMPIGDNAFAALTPGASDLQYTIRLFIIEDEGKTSFSDISDIVSVDEGAHYYYRHMFRTDGYTCPTEDGYAVFNNNSVVLLKKQDAVVNIADYASLSVTTLSKGELSATEKNSKSASFDGKKFWFFTYETNGIDGQERGFYSRSNNSGSWGTPSVVSTPVGPFGAFPAWISWHPDLGMVFRGPGTFFDHESGETDYLYSFMDGNWTDLSHSANMSRLEAASRASKYIAIDPLNSNWIWGNQPMNNWMVAGGLQRIDRGNYDNFLDLSTSNYNWSATVPGFSPLFPVTNLYRDLISFSDIAFDTQNRMWFFRYWPTPEVMFDWEDITEARTPLYYLTAEDRLKMANVGSDANQVVAPHLLKEIPYTQSYHTADLIALKSPGNETRLAGMLKHDVSYFTKFWLYDHKGTLDNPDDDEIVYLENPIDEEGERFDYRSRSHIFEDLATGLLWYCTSSGPVLIDPNDVFAGNMVCRRLKISRKFGAPADDYPLEQVEINDIAVDNLGRKWIASTDGLYCLSADNEDLLGYYNVENSSLPSNHLLAVACDGSTGAVFVSTERGIAEFQPEGSLSPVTPGTSLTIWPASVTPGFNGYVNISGAQEGAEYIVEDAEGNKVTSLGQPENGRLQWQPTVSSPGRYNIRRAEVLESNPVIVVR